MRSAYPTQGSYSEASTMAMTGMPAGDRGLTQKELARRIDHTLLKPTALAADYSRLFDEAVEYHFWSVCIPPSRVAMAAAKLKGTGVKVCTVVGFPLGYTSPMTKKEEARNAIAEGADEIDMVMNVGAFRGREFSTVRSEVREVSAVCKGAGKVLKVIIECCYLTNEEKVRAGRLVERLGADYVKTSTGFGPGGATVKDVALLRKSLAGSAKVKASGGIGTLAKALEMLRAGADRIGTSSGVAIMDELAISRRPKAVKKR